MTAHCQGEQTVREGERLPAGTPEITFCSDTSSFDNRTVYHFHKANMRRSSRSNTQLRPRLSETVTMQLTETPSNGLPVPFVLTRSLVYPCYEPLIRRSLYSYVLREPLLGASSCYSAILTKFAVFSTPLAKILRPVSRWQLRRWLPVEQLNRLSRL